MAFYSCTSLTSVTIPSSVTDIGDYAFAGFDLKYVYSLIVNPFKIGRFTFSHNTYDNAILYVPTNTIDKYIATEGWNGFLYIKEDTPDNVEQAFVGKIEIKSESGILTFQGINSNTLIRVYDIKGIQIGSAISQNNQATIHTNLQPYSVAFVKIGEKNIKVIIK